MPAAIYTALLAVVAAPVTRVATSNRGRAPLPWEALVLLEGE